MARNGKIILAKNIKLDKEYKDVLSYSETQMLSLVNEYKVAEANDYSFIKVGENIISVGFTYATCLQANYIAMQNPNYSNKWFFAFIDEVEYSSNNSTVIHYTIDEHSTWFDYWDPKTCFVVREHVTDDTKGKHTVPENISTGDYKVNSILQDNNNTDLSIIVSSAVTPYDGIPLYGGVYHGIPSALGYYRYEYNEMSDLNTDIQSLANDKKEISALFIAPKWLCEKSGGAKAVKNSLTPAHFNMSIPQITSLDGYTPKNKKTLCYPYCYYSLNNGQSSSVIYKPELWETESDSNNYGIVVYGSLTPGCSIRAIPLKYDGTYENFQEGLNLGKFPQLNWATDPYTNWLTENGLNMAVQGVYGAGQIASGNYLGATISIAQILNQNYQGERIPPQVHGNGNCGDVITATGQNVFTIYSMTVKKEMAQIIDDYFTRYGYLVSELKLPNITGRTYFNYLQIGDTENIGYSTSIKIPVPKKSMDIINNIYRKGTTVWHNHVHVGNYAVDNSI